jgi:hypothetical protein
MRGMRGASARVSKPAGNAVDREQARPGQLPVIGVVLRAAPAQQLDLAPEGIGLVLQPNGLDARACVCMLE